MSGGDAAGGGVAGGWSREGAEGAEGGEPIATGAPGGKGDSSDLPHAEGDAERERRAPAGLVGRGGSLGSGAIRLGGRAGGAWPPTRRETRRAASRPVAKGDSSDRPHA